MGLLANKVALIQFQSQERVPQIEMFVEYWEEKT